MKISKIRTQDLFVLFVLLGISFIFNDGIQSSIQVIDGSPDVIDSKMISKLLDVELTNHTPIVITSNADFNSTNGVISGNGTEDNPYLIANWYINGSSSAHCISITDTTSYFVIENCTLIGNGFTLDYYNGITLTNVVNGFIRYNIASNNNRAIFLDSCSNIVISNNTCSDHNYS